jgi:hypothetical protein
MDVNIELSDVPDPDLYTYTSKRVHGRLLPRRVIVDQHSRYEYPLASTTRPGGSIVPLMPLYLQLTQPSSSTRGTVVKQLHGASSGCSRHITL